MTDRQFKDLIYREIAEIGKAVADPNRLELIELLYQSEKNVEWLSEEIGMSLASTSHHFQKLKKSKLVTDRKEGRFVFFKASPMGVELWESLSGIGGQNISEIKLAVSSFLTSKEYNTVSFRELRGKVKREEILLFDVRPKAEYDTGHFPGAVSLPIKEILEKINTLPRNKDVVAYCRGPHCVFSQSAVDILRDHGITAFRLPQGVVEWGVEGNKLEYSQSEDIA